MQTLLRTPLHERHVAAGARLVPFAGWEMPVQYEGVIPEHRAVRTDCGVFDVSHMGELDVEGPQAQELLQGLLSNDLGRIEDGEAQYTLLTNERGGIVDDLIVYRLDAGPLPDRLQRLEPRAGLRLAEGARDPRLGGARRLRRVRAARRAGPARARAARAPGGEAVHARDGRGRRRRGDGRPHRLHGRGGLRADVPRRGRRSRSGTRCSRRARPPAASARATPCGSRSAIRSTATTSPRTRTRSPPASAGRARSTRTSPAPRSCAGSRRQARSGSSSPS